MGTLSAIITIIIVYNNTSRAALLSLLSIACVLLTGGQLSGSVTSDSFATKNAGASPTAQPLTLSWDPTKDPGVVGYSLYYGTASGAYTEHVDTNYTSINMPPLLPGRSTFCRRRA